MPSTSIIRHPVHAEPGACAAAPQCAVEPSARDPREIDELLRAGFPWLRFPAHLEQRFQRDTAHERLRTLLLSGALVVLFYNSLLLSDWLMIPDQFDQALAHRLFQFTPMMLLGMLVMTRVPKPFWRESMLVISGISAAALNTWLCVSSTDPLAGPYLISLVVVVVYCATVARIRMRPALVLDVVVIGLFMLGWHAIAQAPLDIMAPAVLTLISSVAFTLYATYTQERDVRRNWLMLVRERLLQDDLREAHASLAQASRVDLLTGLCSRHHFDAQLRARWAQLGACQTDVSLMVVHVDHFGVISVPVQKLPPPTTR